MSEDKPTRGTLLINEPHPMAEYALEYLRKIGLQKLARYREVMAACALSGNRPAEVCGETLQRILDGKPISDRYVLGLAWMILDLEVGEKHRPVNLPPLGGVQ